MPSAAARACIAQTWRDHDHATPLLLPAQISFPPHVLDGFSCHAEEVRATFKYKHLKAAFTNVAQREQWSAKVGR